MIRKRFDKISTTAKLKYTIELDMNGLDATLMKRP